jgi:hypothetical protein
MSLRNRFADALALALARCHPRVGSTIAVPSVKACRMSSSEMRPTSRWSSSTIRQLPNPLSRHFSMTESKLADLLQMNAVKNDVSWYSARDM